MLGGVSRRTVRYYVQEGLIPAPLGLGRGNHYTAEHLDQLLRVKAMQEGGRTLDQIRRAVGHEPEGPSEGPVSEERPSRSIWRRISLTPGVELHVAGTVRLPPPAQLRDLAERCRALFVDTNNTHEKEESDHA